MKNSIQQQYDLIYSYFKTTTEQFDSLEWDGSLLQVIFNDKVIEKYALSDLKALINILYYKSQPYRYMGIL